MNGLLHGANEARWRAPSDCEARCYCCMIARFDLHRQSDAMGLGLEDAAPRATHAAFNTIGSQCGG